MSKAAPTLQPPPADNQTKWFRSSPLRAAPSGTVNRGANAIEGVSVVTMGEAKGHGVHIDSEFLDEVVTLGNSKARQGVKMRFGHPNMCSTALGTFLGRAKNFRRVGDIVKCDAFISETAKTTPNGDLHKYVFDMADNEPDQFGTSIVFTPGPTYKRDKDSGRKAYQHVRETSFGIDVWYTDAETGEPLTGDEQENLTEETFVECAALHADDFVDDPAANDGLFSAASIAGEITEHLDNNPEQIAGLLDNKPLLQEIFGRSEFQQFFERYQDYAKTTNTKPVEGEPMNDEETTAADPAEETIAPETEQAETPAEETPAEETPAEETPAADPAVEPEIETGAESPEETEPGAESPEETETQQQTDPIDRDEFNAAFDKFGPEIAGNAFRNGGGFEQARELYIAQLERENEELRKAKPARPARGETGGEFSKVPAQPQRKPRFNTGK